MSQNRKKKQPNNQGIALMELLLALSIGTLVVGAAITVLLVGLRIYRNSTDSALYQTQVQTCITVMENMVAESSEVHANVAGTEVYSVEDEQENLLLKYDDAAGTIVTGAGATILDGVDSFTAGMRGESVLMVQLEFKGQVYDFFLFTDKVVELSASQAAAGLGAEVFLGILESQSGSPGTILAADGSDTGVYYSQWYNSAWASSTPWCSCFVSWALEQCRGYIQGATPKYASVNSFRSALKSTGMWIEPESYEPVRGDLIFFNWNGDSVLDHIGVVQKVEGGKVYTIEGNTRYQGKQVVRQNKPYKLTSDLIVGYGKINWIG